MMAMEAELKGYSNPLVLEKPRLRYIKIPMGQLRVFEPEKAQQQDFEPGKAQQQDFEPEKAQQQDFVLKESNHLFGDLEDIYQRQLYSDLEDLYQRQLCFPLDIEQHQVSDLGDIFQRQLCIPFKALSRTSIRCKRKRNPYLELVYLLLKAILEATAAIQAKRQKRRLLLLLKEILLLLASISFLPGLSSTTSCEKILHEKVTLLIVCRCGDVERNPGPNDSNEYPSNTSRRFCKKMSSLLRLKLSSSKSGKGAHIYKHKPDGHPNNDSDKKTAKGLKKDLNVKLRDLYFLCVKENVCLPDKWPILIEKYFLYTKPVSESDREQCTEWCREQCTEQCTEQCREQFKDQCIKEFRKWLKRQEIIELVQQTVAISGDPDAIKIYARYLEPHHGFISDINRELELLRNKKESVRGEKSDPRTQPTETTSCSREQESHKTISISDVTSERKDGTDSPMNQSNDTSTSFQPDLGSTNTKLPVVQRKRKRSAEAEMEHSLANCQDTNNGLELSISSQASVPPSAAYQENHSACDNHSISAASPTQVTPAGTAVESNALSSNQNEVLPVIDPENDDVLNENLKSVPASPGDYFAWDITVFDTVTSEDEQH